MADELKPHWSPDEPYIRGSLDHTAGLIAGAQALFENDLPHLAYHLALLALEEIGKLEVVLVGRIGDEDDEASFRKKFLDDHVGKIFWAFWGPTFSRQVIDQRQIDWHQNLAKQLHEKRLRGLYTEPYEKGFIAPSEQVTPEDAKALIEMAEMRLAMQREREPAELAEDEKADLTWFRAARYDAQTKDFIVSGGSMTKLAELKNLRAWMKWLHETVKERDAKLLALGEAEINRQLVEGDMSRPKWKFRIRLKTNSHLIKPKAISAWNRLSTAIKWTFVDKKTKDELIVEFELPKSVLASQLYDVGLQFAYRFVVALNIGSQGFFWFDVPLQTERFAESIEDVETGALMQVGRVPVGHVERNITPLSETDVNRSALAFGLMPHDGEAVNSYRQYLAGMVFLAKTDVHAQFQAQAFHAFGSAMRFGMRAYGDWDGKGPFPEAANTFLNPYLVGADDFIAEVDELMRQFIPDKTTPAVNIDQAAKMKILVDYYFVLALEREARRRAESSK